MSFDKNVHNFLSAAFNNADNEKPPLIDAPPPSMFADNKLPWEPDREVAVRTADGHMAVMIEKGNNPYSGTKTPPPPGPFDNNRLDNPAPSWISA